MDDLFGGGGGGGGGGAAAGPAEFFRHLPPITRIYLVSTLACTALINMEFAKLDDVDFHNWEDVIGRGRSGRIEAWRLLTCFLYAGKFGFNVLIGLHLMTQISARYETMGPICTTRRRRRRDDDDDGGGSPYRSRGNSSDYAFALLLGMIGIILGQTLLLPKLPAFVANHGMHHRNFHRHLKFYVLYVWSKQRPHHRVNLFGVTMIAAYLPYAYLLIAYALNNGEFIPVDILHGMLVGHVYYYLACVVPRVTDGRLTVLSTPTALVDVCDWLEGRAGGGGDEIGGMGNGRVEQPALADVDGVIGG